MLFSGLLGLSRSSLSKVGLHSLGPSLGLLRVQIVQAGVVATNANRGSRIARTILRSIFEHNLQTDWKEATQVSNSASHNISSRA